MAETQHAPDAQYSVRIRFLVQQQSPYMALTLRGQGVSLSTAHTSNIALSLYNLRAV